MIKKHKRHKTLFGETKVSEFLKSNEIDDEKIVSSIKRIFKYSQSIKDIVKRLCSEFNISEELRKETIVGNKQAFKNHVEWLINNRLEGVKTKGTNSVELINKRISLEIMQPQSTLNDCSLYSLNKDEKSKIPFSTSDGASVYLLFPAGDNKKPYIGYTGNISERINKHCSDKKWVKRILFFMYNQDSIHFDICDAAYLEYKLIEKLRHTNRKKADEPYVKPESKIILNRVFEDIKHLIKENGLGYLLKH